VTRDLLRSAYDAVSGNGKSTLFKKKKKRRPVFSKGQSRQTKCDQCDRLGSFGGISAIKQRLAIDLRMPFGFLISTFNLLKSTVIV
jgi:hypothetical protein